MRKPDLIALCMLLLATYYQAELFAEEKAPFNLRINATERLRELRKKREQAHEYQLQHQESVRTLESMGCVLEYDLKEDLSKYAPLETPDTAYITNSLGDEILIPVTRIWAHFSHEKLKEFSIELFLPFTHLQFVDLDCCELTLQDIEQLQEFPDLAHVILPKKLFEVHTLEKIQAMLPHCKLETKEYFCDGDSYYPILKYSHPLLRRNSMPPCPAPP